MSPDRLDGDHRRWPGAPSLLRSFNFAFEGLVWALRRERNMRVHFASGVAVIVLAVALGVTRLELVVLLVCISLVVMAELVNTAVEAAVDIAKPSFDPLAKIAKDVAAGAVLVASATALAVAWLVFSPRLGTPTASVVERVRSSSPTLTVLVFTLVLALVIAGKAWTGRGTPLRGGWPSGHAAIAFSSATAILLLTGDSEHGVLAASLAIVMALLVAQTRVEAGVHSLREVAAGGVLGALVAMLVFQGWP